MKIVFVMVDYVYFFLSFILLFVMMLLSADVELAVPLTREVTFCLSVFLSTWTVCHRYEHSAVSALFHL